MTEQQPFSFRPGFYRLNLNLMHIEDKGRIEYKKSLLDEAKVIENPVVHYAVNLMNNLIDNRFSSSLKNNIKNLKKSLKTNPNHLNTLADLAEMHRKINLDKEAKIYDVSIQKVLSSNEFGDRKEIANYILEQGYACLFEDFGNYERKARINLKEASKQLMVEVSNTRGERKKNLQYATHYTLKAQSLLSPMFIQPMNQHLLDKRQRSVEFLKEGIKRLKILTVDKEEITVWKFYLAMACNKLYSSVRKCTDENTNTERILTELTNDSCCLLLEVITDLPQDTYFAIYRARSYAYIAYNLISRRIASNDIFNIDLKGIENGKAELDALQRDPTEGFLEALRICPKDEVILHRYGEVLLKKSKSELNEHDKLCMLEKAEKLLTTAIDSNRKPHLVTYGTRVNVYIAMFDLQSGDKQRSKTLLNAFADGLFLMKEDFITLNYCDIAMVSQYLAKFPQCQSFGKKFVQDVQYIQEALSLLNTALRIEGQTYALANRFESVLFDSGEYETATEWAKRAFLLSKTPFVSNVKHTCRYMLEGNSDLGDLFNVLTFVAGKYKNMDEIRDIFTFSLIKNNSTKLCDFLTYLQSIQLNENQVLLAEFIEKIIRERLSEINYKIRKLRFQRTKDIPLLYTQSDIDKTIDGRVQCTHETGERFKAPTTFEFDFSVIAGKDDVGWIKCFILHQLSLQLFKDDVALRGRPLSVDHDSYSSIILDLLDAAHTSRRTLLFLSESFLNREWPLLKITIMNHLKKRPDFLILLVLDNSTIPDELENLTNIDIANDQQIPFEIDILKTNLLESRILSI